MIERTLIISDPHLRISRVEKIIKYEAPDRVIILGDFFDHFTETIDENQEAADWVKDNIHKPNYSFAIGNHDIHYVCQNPYTRCSGYQFDKFVALREILTMKDWLKFVWFYWLGDILLTHAGLTHGLANEQAKRTIGGVKEVKRLLAKNEEIAWKNLLSNKKHWFYQAGISRGGREYFGGILWNDAKEFVPIPGVRQVFGHTPLSEPKVYKDGSICLDTHNNHYIVFTNDIQILNYHDIPN